MMTPDNPVEALRAGLDKALYLAVGTLAFHGRDRGTGRQEVMLDGLETVAREADPIIRKAIAALATATSVKAGELPDIHAEGERLANETWKHPTGNYLWTDLVGAIQTAIAEERARHVDTNPGFVVSRNAQLHVRHGVQSVPDMSAEVASSTEAFPLDRPNAEAHAIAAWNTRATPKTGDRAAQSLVDFELSHP